MIDGSLLCDGCQVFGRVERSIIGPGAVIEAGAAVSDSIIMNGAVIGAGARIERSIIDKRAVIGADAVIGDGDDNTPNRAMPNNLNTGSRWWARARRCRTACASAATSSSARASLPARCRPMCCPAGRRCSG